MSATVYTTAGGRRFHAESWCPALTTGRDLYGWLCSGFGPVYPLDERNAKSAARAGYTACRVCVPPALALPPTGETYGHEPVTGVAFGGRVDTVCQRCTVPGLAWGWDAQLVHIPWPCTSAVVLGLVPRCPDCRRGVDVPGGRKCASCEHSDQIDALGGALW